MIVDYCDEKLEIKQNLNIEFSNQVLEKKKKKNHPIFISTSDCYTDGTTLENLNLYSIV